MVDEVVEEGDGDLALEKQEQHWRLACEAADSLARQQRILLIFPFPARKIPTQMWGPALAMVQEYFLEF